MKKSLLEISEAPRSVVEMIIRKNIKSVVEIGVYRQSFCKQVLKTISDRLDCYWLVDPWCIEHCTDGSGSTYTIDQWENEYINACRLMFNYGCVKILRMTSLKAAGLFGRKSVGLVYIDGSHIPVDVVDDIKAWLPKIKSGGIIAGHDYGAGWPGVVNAVNSQFELRQIQLHGGTVWSVTVN